MLTSKKQIKRRRKSDWFPIKTYLHFDSPISREAATKLVTDVDAVKRHSFLPLIEFETQQRHYRRVNKKLDSGKPQVKSKSRRIAYCSNVDACIFSYYATMLNEHYEAFIKQKEIDDVVIGYRKVGSNIDLAFQVFSEVVKQRNCVAFCFDIRSFFDNIDHDVLKRNWCRMLNTSFLPEDQFKIFQRLTKFSTVNRNACLRRLGMSPSKRDREFDNKRLCCIEDFRNKIRGSDGTLTSLVIPWRRDYRIPQGTPISALAANIAMIDFDVKLRSAVNALSGFYRRYSDDVLIIVPSANRNNIPTIFNECLKLSTRRLEVKADKTEETEFIDGLLAAGPGTKPLQYLGFLLDGERYLLRPSTIAKLYRRMHHAVGAARRCQRQVLAGEKIGRNTLHKRALYLRHTHLGKDSFINGYAKKAQTVMRGQAIRHQLSKHDIILKMLINQNKRVS